MSKCRELLDSMQAGTLEPEVALLNALLVCDMWARLRIFIMFVLHLLSFFNVSHENYGDQIPDIFPVLAAAHKTLLSNSRGSLTTRTLHSELVYNYSGSKHVC